MLASAPFKIDIFWLMCIYTLYNFVCMRGSTILILLSKRVLFKILIVIMIFLNYHLHALQSQMRFGFYHFLKVKTNQTELMVYGLVRPKLHLNKRGIPSKKIKEEIFSSSNVCIYLILKIKYMKFRENT